MPCGNMHQSITDALVILQLVNNNLAYRSVVCASSICFVNYAAESLDRLFIIQACI